MTDLEDILDEIGSQRPGISFVNPSLSNRDAQIAVAQNFVEWKHHRNRHNQINACERILRDIDKVIFPYQVWIQRWDTFMLFLIVMYMLILPYQIGVEGLHYITFSLPWVVVNTCVNSIFFVDSMFYFRRPYINSNGKWVIDLRTIRKRYLRTMFIPDMLSIVPYDLIYWFYEELLGTQKAVILAFGILKLLRLLRIRSLTQESQVVINIRLKHNSRYIRLAKFSFLIILMSHMLACFWCWIAYIENGSLSFGESHNWISGWVDDNEPLSEKSLHPYGLSNHTDRYVLALFWGIQTVTSIGYGNIVPQTVTEFWIACFLQLLAGIFWSYFLGGLLNVVAGFDERLEFFGERSDDATDLIRGFQIDNEDTNMGRTTLFPIEKKDVTRRIRKYIYTQHRGSGAQGCVITLDDMFPVIKTLPPMLQEQSCVLLFRGYFNFIPYLSSYYLGTRAQAQIVKQCVQLELPAGETIEMDSGPEGLGRGIYIMQIGCAVSRVWEDKKYRWKRSLFVTGTMIGMGKVLLEDTHDDVTGTRLFFMTHSKVLFVPRTAILTALEKNPEAWKGSGRWIYARTVLSKSDVTQAYNE
mmetsp:Transcript_21424/g.32530  ORF Transcript_21424/g.32530 Transcript_21424/m.32530 type:complete len:583 (+) Transcript_21424:201-1949(+)